MLEHPVPSPLTVWAESVFYQGYFQQLFWHSVFSSIPALLCSPSLRQEDLPLCVLVPASMLFPMAPSHQPDPQTKVESQTWDLQALAKALSPQPVFVTFALWLTSSCLCFPI